MSKIILLSGSTMGDALGGIGRSCREAFETEGLDFAEVSLSGQDSIQRLNSELQGSPIEFVFTFMGMAADLRAIGQDGKEVNFWQASGIPFISIYGDTPAYFFDRHVLPGDGFAGLYAFPEHLALRKRLPHARGLMGLVPRFPLDATPAQRLDFARKERGKLFFLKNGNDPNQLVEIWRERFPTPVFLMLAELASDLASNLDDIRCNDIDGAVSDYFRDKGLDLAAATKLRLLFIAQLDDYLRRMKSTWIAKMLMDFPVEIHGYNWEHIDFSGRRATLVHGGDYTASRNLIETALGLIDMSPNTGGAPHERCVRAFGMKTLCLTNEQEYFAQRFPEANDFMFKFDADQFQGLVAEVLAHPKRYVESGIAAAERFAAENPAPEFARRMLEIAACVRTINAPRPAGLQDYFVWPPVTLSH